MSAIGWLSRLKNWLYKHYDAGVDSRLNKGWTPIDGTGEEINASYRQIVRDRARDLERNIDIMEAIISPFERNVVGTGIQLQAKVQENDGQEDEALNREIEYLWKEWCKPKNCDVSGRFSFGEMQRMAVRRRLVDGEVLFIKSQDKDGFKLQIREADCLDNSSFDASGKIVGGIELDAYQKATAYYLETGDPGSTKLEKLPADRVIYLAYRTRPTEIRGFSALAKTATRIRDISEYVTALSVKERVLACLSVFITKIGGGSIRGSRSLEKKQEPRRSLSPGMIEYLENGEKVDIVNPSGQASNARDFISALQRLTGAGQGLSYEAVSRDMSQVNYSSARQGLLEDRGTYQLWQEYLIEHFCDEVYDEFLKTAVLRGDLKIPGYWQEPERYSAHKWLPVGLKWIDPLKEANANRVALESNQTTLAKIAAERGEDWRENLLQRKLELEYMRELGLTGGDESGNKGAPTEGAAD